MIKKLSATTLIFSLATSFTYASVCHIDSGTTYCGQGTIPVLIAEGPAQLNGTHVLGTSLVEGKLTAQSANLNTMKVQGKTDISNSTVSGVATLQGSLNNTNTNFQANVTVQGHLDSQDATYSNSIYVQGGVNSTKDTFNQQLVVEGDSVYFSGTSASNIFVRPDSSSQGVVCLSNSSKATGVTFSSAGTVYVDGSSSVGPIKNGTISHDSCPSK